MINSPSTVGELTFSCHFGRPFRSRGRALLHDDPKGIQNLGHSWEQCPHPISSLQELHYLPSRSWSMHRGKVLHPFRDMPRGVNLHAPSNFGGNKLAFVSSRKQSYAFQVSEDFIQGLKQASRTVSIPEITIYQDCTLQTLPGGSKFPESKRCHCLLLLEPRLKSKTHLESRS